jgi:hypothetical protein
MTAYRLESDDPATSWNELLRRLNEAAEECNVDPLELLEDPAIWSKIDVQEVQDKFAEMCPDTFEDFFDEIPDIWKQSLVDELVSALEDVPECCCEEEDRDHTSEKLIDVTDFFFPNLGRFLYFDWAGWIMAEVIPLTITQIACSEESVIQRRSGGRGWVGRGFKRWEMRVQNTLIATGDVIDGYIDVGEGQWEPEPDCGVAPGNATPLGTQDSEWRFPYSIFPEEEPGAVILDRFGVEIFELIGDDETGFVNLAIVSSPYVAEIDQSFDPEVQSVRLEAVLRLLCDAEV